MIALMSEITDKVSFQPAGPLFTSLSTDEASVIKCLAEGHNLGSIAQPCDCQSDALPLQRCVLGKHFTQNWPQTSSHHYPPDVAQESNEWKSDNAQANCEQMKDKLTYTLEKSLSDRYKYTMSPISANSYSAKVVRWAGHWWHINVTQPNIYTLHTHSKGNINVTDHAPSEASCSPPPTMQMTCNFPINPATSWR